MNNGIHYYDQLKSSITQGVLLLLNSLQIVGNNAAPVQVISYPNMEAIDKGVFSSTEEKYIYFSRYRE